MSAPIYVPVRQNEDGEWLDYAAVSHMREIAEDNATENDRTIPHWASANPVIRIAKLSVTEIPTP